VLESPFAPGSDPLPEQAPVPDPMDNFRKDMASRLEECRRLTFREDWFMWENAYAAYVPLVGYVPEAIEHKLKKALPMRWEVAENADGYWVYWKKVEGENFDGRYFRLTPGWDRVRCYVCEFLMVAPRRCFFCDRPPTVICDRCHGLIQT
jgi:hypothetical protein